MFQPDLTFLRASSINAKTIAATKIGTTENGTQRFYPLWATISVATATAILSVGVASIGTNSATYNNIFTALGLTGLTAANQMLLNMLTTAGTSVAANTDIFLNITTGFTATTATIDIELWGYYR